jgi:kojibiose phosphorylase
LPVALTADPDWILVEEGFTLTREHEVESLFAIGNGYVGSRGSLAEGSALSAPATVVAGVYDAEPGAAPGLVVIADWSQWSITVEGEPLRLDRGHNLEHRRILDMRQGLLWREWRHKDEAGRITRLHALRFTSMSDRHLLVRSVTITPENYGGRVRIDAALTGFAAQVTRRGTSVAVAVADRVLGSDGYTIGSSELVDGRQSLGVEEGKTYRLDRVAALHTSRDTPQSDEVARSHAERAVEHVANVVEEHCAAWLARWHASDVRIEGDPAAQRALRFAAYHLLSAANPQDERVSIGARGLSGPAYMGHVFWDTEVFMLPFYLLTYPEAARSLLMYRFHTLAAARANAARRGFRGAFYAWESADTGEDMTPPFVIAPDGEVVRILTGEQEQHISADVAYAVWNYWRTTGDDRFLVDAGAEILIETARFWASRVTLEDDKRYHIRGVIGPDEYHEAVDDNAYTNGMAQWNLEAAAEVAENFAERWPDQWQALSLRLGLADEERHAWQRVARDLYTGFNERTGLFEQFQGYFALEDIDITAYATRTAPMDVLLGRERITQSQVIKQPDVVMLVHLLWDRLPPEVRRINFDYYEPRCGHGSSLSPAIHALVAARLGDTELAGRYFRQSAEIDLANNMGNAASGVHVGALGGLWQATVFGFIGLRLTEKGPECDPRLPEYWRSLSMRFQFRGHWYELNLPARGAIAQKGNS